MKEYLVQMPDADYINIFIVLAKDAKDAINQVFENEFKWQNERLRKENKDEGMAINHIFVKSDLTARSIGSLHNEQGKIITIN